MRERLASSLLANAQDPGWAFKLRGQQFFSVKDLIVNIVGCAGHTDPVATTERCSYNWKAVLDSAYMNGFACVPIKLYL